MERVLTVKCVTFLFGWNHIFVKKICGVEKTKENKEMLRGVTIVLFINYNDAMLDDLNNVMIELEKSVSKLLSMVKILYEIPQITFNFFS